MLRTRLTLKPGRSGTRDLVEQYGSKLVCVRYRYDDELGIRYKTVELIVDEKPWTPPTARYRPTDLVHIKIEDHESQLRAAIKLLGGRYHRPTGTWLVAYAAVTALRLLNRITPISNPPAPPTRISPRSGSNEEKTKQRHDDEMAALQWRVGVGSK